MPQFYEFALFHVRAVLFVSLSSQEVPFYPLSLRQFAFIFYK